MVKYLLIFLLLSFLPTSPVLAEAPVAFRLGIINERPDKPDHALNQYGKLETYLRQHLAPHGIEVVKLVIAHDIDEMANKVANREVDALIEGVMPTLSIQRQTEKLEPTLLAWRKGQRQYHTVFFVRKESEILNLRDLRGRTIAFEAARSTSAYFVPRAELLAAGLSLAPAEDTGIDADRVRYRFAGSELNQAYWVHRGLADVGAFNNGDWDRLPEAIKQDFRIIHSTRPLLRWLLSFVAECDARIRQRVTDILVAAHHDGEGGAALEHAARIARFEPFSASDKESLDYWTEVLAKVD